MFDFRIDSPLLVKDTPKPRSLGSLAEAATFVADAMRLGRPQPWRDMYQRLRAARSEDEAIEVIGALRELLELEDLLIPPKLGFTRAAGPSEDAGYGHYRGRRKAMIKDVMLRLDGTAGDEVRLAAGNDIAELFDSQVIGVFLNILPVVIAAEDGIGAARAAELLQAAREAGDKVEARLRERLNRLQKPVELRRFDILSDAAENVVAREARAADTFVALRPNGAPQEPEQLVESVLFGSGRHLFLVPNRRPTKTAFNRIMLAWNGSRESARALAEALPYLHNAAEAAVVVVDDEPPLEARAILGSDAVMHLKHHAVNADLNRVRMRDNDVGMTLIAEARRLKADLIVMGAYGHSRVREWLLGGATYTLLHKAPIPLLIAH
jgi:nucleotide-binding universal stress UspA family protein